MPDQVQPEGYFARERSLLKDAIIFLPALHLLVCFIYLSVYFTAFGSRLELFASPGDIFSVSFISLVPFYILTALPQAIIVANNLHKFSKVEPGHIVEYHYSFKYFLWFLGTASILTLGMAIMEWSETGLIPAPQLALGLGMPTATVLPYALRKRPPYIREVAPGLALAVTFLVYLGINDAQKDRYYPIQMLQSSPLCKNFRLLRPLGDRFLAVRNDGVRAVVGVDCNVTALIPKSDKRYLSPGDALHAFTTRWF